MTAAQQLPVLTTAQFRFYGYLRRFLSLEHRNKSFFHTVKGHPSIKDTLEALGVPHTEIDYISANGRWADFDYHLRGAERICIYPPGYASIGKVKRLAVPPRGTPRFVVDSHLGRLVRHLRLLGFDSVYRNIFPDPEIIQIGISENRIILTRDIGLLKNKVIRYGCFLNNIDSLKQLREVMQRYNLYARIRPFRLCLECNGKIGPIAKNKIGHLLPPKVKQYYNRFYCCRSCAKIYWKGSHYDKMLAIVHRVSNHRGSL
jgi:uncharacterized protein with PIN domain